MSLSQKHSGLILVPWFNSEEWRYVYKLVYSNERENQLEALELLKIWKARTPILSTGIEGTLILLDVLVIETDCLLEEQVTNLYAVALMRFLNLSAANSEKQGSFKKTSAKNELPKWLMNLRHDIAHGHQMPSKYNLKMGLDFGFHWLKEKYWDPQNKIIRDYYISDETTLDNNLTNILKMYIELNIYLFENDELKSELYNKIKTIIWKRYKTKNLDPKSMLGILLEMITQIMEDGNNTEKFHKCLDYLVSTNGLLRPNFDIASKENDNIKINQNFLKIWMSLLNQFHRHGLLFHIVNRLFDAVGTISHFHEVKKMAALWIKEIFSALQNLKNPDDSHKENVLCLEEREYVYTQESLEFQVRVLSVSSEVLKPYVTDFMNNLLEYNVSNEKFISCALNLLKIDTSVENIHIVENKIFTINDLNNKTLDENMDTLEMVERVSDLSHDNEKQIVASNKWQKVDGSSLFRNCPLGVLPHQIGRGHPFFILA